MTKPHCTSTFWIFFGFMICLAFPPALASSAFAPHSYTCQDDKGLQAAVDAVRTGQTLTVSCGNTNCDCGTSIVIPADISVQGQPDGDRRPQLKNGDTLVQIYGTRGSLGWDETLPTISGFDLSQASRVAIFVSGAAAAVIRGNTITNPQGGTFGIVINEGSSARIMGNTVSTKDHAILVTEGSTARIGFGGVNTTPRPEGPMSNTLQSTEGDGVRVQRGSSAQVAGNDIQSYGKNGVSVIAGSSADVTNNNIKYAADKNSIYVSMNSYVFIGSTQANNPFHQANNGVLSLRCYSASFCGSKPQHYNTDPNVGEYRCDARWVDSLQPGMKEIDDCFQNAYRP